MEQQSKDIRNTVNFLQKSKAGMHIHVGILNGKRIDCFKGIPAPPYTLTLPAYAKLKNVPPIADAQKLPLTPIPYAFCLHIERGAPTGSSANLPKVLQITQMLSHLVPRGLPMDNIPQ